MAKMFKRRICSALNDAVSCSRAPSLTYFKSMEVRVAEFAIHSAFFSVDRDSSNVETANGQQQSQENFFCESSYSIDIGFLEILCRTIDTNYKFICFFLFKPPIPILNFTFSLDIWVFCAFLFMYYYSSVCLQSQSLQWVQIII